MPNSIRTSVNYAITVMYLHLKWFESGLSLVSSRATLASGDQAAGLSRIEFDLVLAEPTES